jgi:3-hydroxyacyl-CoA dehydrogenase/enoyl-CoA hydratase/3-hydroxybutyryl-CoA epimerase
LGSKTFVARAKELSAQYGSRFEPGEGLAAMAETGESFYKKYAPAQKAA